MRNLLFPLLLCTAAAAHAGGVDEDDVPPPPPANAPPPVGPGIQVVAGTYGQNCRAPYGNVTKFLAAACNGQYQCNYKVDYTVIGDPAYGCGKDYFAEWRCNGQPQVYRATAAAEAGFGSMVNLACPGAAPSYPPAVATPPPSYPPPGYPPPGYPPPTYAPAPVYVPPPQPVYGALAAPQQFVYQPRWRLFSSGLSLFLISYLMDISVTYGMDHHPADKSLIPIAGPIMQMSDSFSSEYANTAKAWLGLDFVGQLAGLTMAILGLSVWQKVPVARYGERPAPRLTLVPLRHGSMLSVSF